MHSWRDYHLAGYAVDGARRAVTLQLAWPHETGADVRRAQLLFTGVEGYHFEGGLGVNIVFSIEEGPLDDFLAEEAVRLERERPLFWRGTVEGTLAECEARLLKLFEITASYGLT